LAECELPAFTRVRVAFIRALYKDSVVIKQQGGVVVSSAEPRISITFPRDALSNSKKITLVVGLILHGLYNFVFAIL
jgi:hypothetical protein